MGATSTAPVTTPPLSLIVTETPMLPQPPPSPMALSVPALPFPRVLRGACIEPVRAAAASTLETGPVKPAMVVDYGPGGGKGFGSFTAPLFQGAPVQIIVASAPASSLRPGPLAPQEALQQLDVEGLAAACSALQPEWLQEGAAS